MEPADTPSETPFLDRLASADLTARERDVAREAEAHYRATWDIIAKCPRKVTKAPRLMAAAYRLYLDAVLARGWEKPRARVKPSKRALLGVVLRHGIV